MSDFFNYIQGLFVLSPIIAWTIVSLVIAGLIISILWNKLGWWLHNFRFNFWKIKELAKKPNTDVNTSGKWSGWYNSETELCASFAEYISVIDKKVYDNVNEYISAAGDAGRHPIPVFIWMLTIVIIIIEAFGFSYVLAGYAIPGVSENDQQVAGFAIAVLISIALVFLTHFSGEELSIAQAIKQARKESNNDKTYDYDTNIVGRRTQIDRRQLIEDNHGKFPISTKPVDLGMDQFVDKDEPNYSRRLNRIQKGNTPTYNILKFTVVAVLLIASIATYVRVQVLNEMLEDERNGQISELSPISEATKDLMTFDGDKSEKDDLLPPEEDQNEAREATITNIDRGLQTPFKGGTATFAALAVVFLAIQILSTYFSYVWSFLGKETKGAYKAIMRSKYSTYDEYKREANKRVDKAETALMKLHILMKENNANYGMGGIKPVGTFRAYLDAMNKDEPKQNDKETNEVIKTDIDAEQPAKQNKSVELAEEEFDVNKVMKTYLELENEADKMIFQANLSESQREVFDELLLKIEKISKKARGSE